MAKRTRLGLNCELNLITSRAPDNQGASFVALSVNLAPRPEYQRNPYRDPTTKYRGHHYVVEFADILTADSDHECQPHVVWSNPLDHSFNPANRYFAAPIMHFTPRKCLPRSIYSSQFLDWLRSPAYVECVGGHNPPRAAATQPLDLGIACTTRFACLAPLGDDIGQRALQPGCRFGLGP